jgi:hypothetical protein
MKIAVGVAIGNPSAILLEVGRIWRILLNGQ